MLGAHALQEKPRTSAPGEVRCTSVVLVDGEGKSVATLETDADGWPRLRLAKGGAHATLALTQDSAGLASGATGGVSYVGVSGGSPYFSVRGANLRTGVWAGVTEEGSAGFRANGETLKVGVSLEVGPDGAPLLRLADRQGRSVFEPGKRTER